ncbi:MAG: LacI family DNA-binding transcriptional regulator [Clostridia bacterium]|nr:LacI family DNA-binding transcriptional regulator [Clostridia bacterium]
MTLKDIAKLCNVSVSTVSKAFCDADDVSRETKQFIFETAKENGCYEKYYKGRYHKFVVAVICPEIDSQFYARFIERLEDAIEREGGVTVIAIDRFDGDRQRELIEYFSANNRADGIVVYTLKQLKKGYDIPIISIGNKVPTVDSVKSEMDCAIDDAVTYLKTLGHKKAAFIGEPLTLSKQDKFLKSAAMQGLKVDGSDVIVSQSRFEDAGYSGAKRLIEQGTDSTAIVCAYDYIAIGAMRYLEQEGYRIPDDFSVVGMDNIDTSKYLAQSLTTIDNHLDELCTVVADLMAKKVRNRWVTARQEIKISADLIVRESTGKAKVKKTAPCLK